MKRKAYFLVPLVFLLASSCNQKEKEQKEIQHFEDSIKKEEKDLTQSKKAATEFITQRDSTISH